MFKRRLPKREVREIASERMSKLAKLSVEAMKAGKIDRAERYVTLALRIGQKTKTKMPEGFAFCKECHRPLVPGYNQRVRVTRRRVISTCDNCGCIKRMPYIKEKQS